jgi:hypothetical protein
MPDDLTAEQIQKITGELVVLRKAIQHTGATVLSPTPLWDKLRKEISALNKKLNEDSKSKDKAREAARIAEADVSGADVPV